MNLYFGDFANTAEFFDESDFVYYTGISYADLLGQEYIGMYNQMRQDGDNNAIEFSHDWLKTEVAKKQKDSEGYYFELSQPVMSFPYSKSDIGIQNIFPVGTEFKGEFLRGSISDIWQNNYIPLTQHVFWFLLENKVYAISNMLGLPNEVRFVYVPAAGDDLEIPASRQKMVIDNTIKMMRDAAHGNLIKETNNQNLNKIPQTEVDRQLIK